MARILTHLERLELERVPIGSAGPDAMAIARSEAVALAWGLHASRVDGSPLIYNQQADASVPDLPICRPADGGAVMQTLAATSAGSPSETKPQVAR